MRVAEREVGRVIGHRAFGGGDVELHVAQAEVLVGRFRSGQAAQRVFLMFGGAGIQRVFEEHVRVQRVVFGLDDFLVERVIDGGGEVELFGKQLAQLEAGGDAVVIHVFLVALIHVVFDAPEAGGFDVSRQVDAAEVGELHVQGALRGPSAVVAVFLQAEFVDPDFDRFHLARVVAYADHDCLHLAQCRVAHDADLVVRLVCVVGGEKGGQVGVAEALFAVAGLLHVGEDGEVDVQHVFFRPHGAALVTRIGVIASFRGQLEGNFVFVEVVAVVRAEADEHAGLPVFRFGHVFGQGVGVDEHLQVLVLPHVEVGVLIHGAGVSRGQVAHGERKGLLVFLRQLGLRGVHHAADARGKHVVHGGLVVVLLDVHRRDFHRAARGRHLARVEGLLVGTPLGFHQVKGGEAQDDGLFEVGHEHAHEADAGEVVDVAHFLFVFVHGDAELVPVHLLRVAVAQLHAGRAPVHDVVLTHDEVFRTDADAVLVIFFVFVQRVVLVDVFHVGGGFVGGVVGLVGVLV